MNRLDIDERFFNLNPATLANIHEFKRSRDPALIHPIFEGIMRNYLPEGMRDTAEIPMDDAFSTFGLDSLTLLEVVLDLQDALDIRLSDEDVRGLATPKDAHALVVQKVEALRRGEATVPPAIPAP